MANALLLEPAAVAAVIASSTAVNYRAMNCCTQPRMDAMGLRWRSDPGAASQSLTFDMGTDVPVDTIALFGLRGALPTWDWSIDLATEAQGPFAGSYWAGGAEDLLAGSEVPLNDLGKALWMAPAGAPTLARHVRINFLSLSNAAVEVAVAAIGAKIQLERNFRFGAAFGVRPLGSVDWSTRGVLMRRKGRKLRGVGISFFNIYRDEVEAQMQPLLHRVGNDTALVIVTDPSPDAYRQDRMFYGFLTGNIGTIWARPGGFQADLNLVALD